IALPDARTLANAGAIVMTVAAAAGFSAISLFRYVHCAANGFDLGIQDQTVWGYSRLEMIPNTVLGVPNLLGDHFNPILMLLAPLYWLWPSAATLLVAQAVLLALAGIPIYLWAGRRVGHVAGLAFLGSYLLFWGVLAGAGRISTGPTSRWGRGRCAARFSCSRTRFAVFSCWSPRSRECVWDSPRSATGCSCRCCRRLCWSRSQASSSASGLHRRRSG